MKSKLLIFFYYLTESGIIADILTSPEIESHTPLDQPPNWPPNNYTKLPQSQNVNNNKTQMQHTRKLSVPNTQTQKSDVAPSTAVTTDTTSTNSNPYISNDSIAVHL